MYRCLTVFFSDILSSLLVLWRALCQALGSSVEHQCAISEMYCQGLTVLSNVLLAQEVVKISYDRSSTLHDLLHVLLLPDGEFPRGTVVGIDLLHIAPLDGAHFLSNHDITDSVTHAKLLELLPGAQAHVIMSDMAPNASGFKEMDHEKLITMSLSLIDLAAKVLQTGGSLICKYWDGALAHQLQQKLSAVFRDVRTVKPKASRKESSELFFLARSYRKNKIV